MNTKVGQLFLLGLFLRHYFVDSHIRNLLIGYRRVSCLKKIFSLYIVFMSVVFTQLLPRTPNHYPLPRHWTRDRDFRPATATLDPRPRLWTRDPRLLVKLNGPFHLMNQPKFPEFWVEWKAPIFSSTLFVRATLVCLER